MSNLTLGSLFDGSGGFPLGALMNGITPLWASEIEPFPIRVTTKRIPQMKHYGDISKLNGADLPPVDIISFGSPCTCMSVAGKRSGLDSGQSALFFEAIRIIKEMRRATNGKYPRFIVFENVPGAFSSGQGNDFRKILEEIVKIKDETSVIPMPETGSRKVLCRWMPAGELVGNGYSIAYRTMDAQHWGVAQRRRRICLVADFASERAGKILFEFESLSGYTPQGFDPGQRASTHAQSGTGTASNSITCLNDQGGRQAAAGNSRTELNARGQIIPRAESLDAKEGAGSACHPPCVLQSSGFCTEHSAKSRGVGFEEERSPTLRAGDVPEAVAIENHPTDGRCKIETDGKVQTLTSRMGTGGMNCPLVMNERQYALTVSEDVANTLTSTDYKGTQCVFEPTAYGICSDASNSMLSANPNSGIYEAETSRTIDQNGGNPSCNQGGIAVVALQGSMIGRQDSNGPNGSGIDENVSFTLNTVDRHSIAYALDRAAYNQGQNAHFDISVQVEMAQTIVAKGPGAVAQPLKAEYTVRRLTPTECALLQGFPPDWCSNLGSDNPTEEEIIFWVDVFETYRKIIGKSDKPKSRKQIIKWLENPHSDSAEYKMWGNGVALPNVCFVMAGIVWLTQTAGQ